MKGLTLFNTFLDKPSLFELINEDFRIPHQRSSWSYWTKEDDLFKINLEMPGVKKNELKIEVDEGLIKISAENDKRNYQFSTSYPKTLDPETLEASLEDGILELKAKSKEKPVKLIQIK